MLNCKPTRLNATVLTSMRDAGCDRMDTLLCHRATPERAAARILGILLLTALSLSAQTPAGPTRPSWRRVGSNAIDLALASPASGPVSRVWFSPDGSRLYAMTPAGRVFESADLETWSAAANTAAGNTVKPPAVSGSATVRLPAPGVKLYPQD